MGNTTLPYSIEAIYTAHDNADKMTRQGYIVENTSDDVFGASFKVKSPAGFVYKVYPFGLTSADAPECSCEQCEQEGYCKHIVHCANIANDLAEYEYWMQDNERSARMAEEREFADFNYERGYGS